MDNVGKSWTSDSEQLLLALIKTNDVAVCAQKLKRTDGAVIARLKKIALEMHKDGKSLADIVAETMIPTDTLENMIYLFELPNYNAPWDSEQDAWLKKYIKKLGANECASKMGRALSEINKRVLVIAIEDASNNIPIEKVCNNLRLSVEDLQRKLNAMKNFVSLEQLETVEPPYYVVLNGRFNGIYSDIEGLDMATVGVENTKYKKCATIEDARKYIGYNVATIEYKAHTVIENHTTDIILSDEQNKVIDAVFTGKNILLLGSAGVGKSLLIKHIALLCKDRDISICITSSTGCSAVLINGRTIHSYLGIGLGKDSPKELARSLFYKNKKKAKELQELQILLIDEISMLDGDLLKKISEYLSVVRNSQKPFGGIQTILSGDFYQLPPVSGSFAFKSDIWESLNFSCHVLTKIYRQDGDVIFQGILERAKTSSVTDDDIKILKACKGQTFKADVKPTCLSPINAAVDIINKEAYDLLEGVEMVYNTVYSTKESKSYCESTKVPAFIKLKVGAQIIVTRNVSNDLKLANGTRGVVIELHKDYVVIMTLYGVRNVTRFECINDNDKRLLYHIMPIALAWAITIHKAQGVTLDCCSIDIGDRLFACGQAYTALSRVKSLNGLCVTNISKSAFKTHPDVIEFYKNIQNK